ncbi:prephenate dehydratase domain-containing protein, partial [Micromonospora sp. BL1]|uniref:prephenate dehydratase domain-containing protein n=1 Tax=Micromonospora sp. BL1 TaxID=2478709 RepID=UPI00272B71BA
MFTPRTASSISTASSAPTRSWARHTASEVRSSPVEFVLAARAGTTLSDVRSVAAHPQASTQCRGWLREHL